MTRSLAGFHYEVVSFAASTYNLGFNDLAPQAADLFFEALEEDSVLAAMLADFEGLAAEDSEAVDQLAAMDSLLAADADLSELMQELEASLAEDPDLLEAF